MDQAENCAKCGCLPDDILTLTCAHDLCLSCAATNLVREMRKYGDNTKAIMCELCGAPTILDESSVEELVKIASGNTQENLPYTSSTYTPNRQYQAYSPVPDTKQQRTPYQQGPDLNKLSGVGAAERASVYQERKTMRAFCIEHPDEEISYFCFDCLSNCVCPECVIHGAHRNHNVLTVKKSYNMVKAKIEEFLNGFGSKLDEERMLEDKFINSKRELKDNNIVLKRQVSEVFQEIRNRIEKKEKEILNIMDVALDDALKEVDLFIKSLENKAAVISGSFDLVKNHLGAKDEVLLLNFYANNHDKLKQQMDSEETNFTKLQESYIPKVPINFNEILDSLNILQLQVSAIGNVAPEKFRKYPAAPDYSLQQNVYGGSGSKENRSRSKKESAGGAGNNKEQFLNALSSYNNNMSHFMKEGSANKVYVQESAEKMPKPGNFRNFQNTSASKGYSETRGTPYS